MSTRFVAGERHFGPQHSSAPAAYKAPALADRRALRAKRKAERASRKRGRK